MKTCSRCHLEKPLDEYGKESARPDGLRIHCLPCESRRQQAYYATHAEQRKAYARAYGRKHGKAIRQRQKAKRTTSGPAGGGGP